MFLSGRSWSQEHLLGRAKIEEDIMSEELKPGDIVQSDSHPAYGSYAGKLGVILSVKMIGSIVMTKCWFPAGPGYPSKLFNRTGNWLTKVC